MRTSVPRDFADCSASKMTAAGSAPVPCSTIGTPLRSAQTASCSTAAARKVSPAATMTDSPWSLSRRASLPIVVVLPEPFTPTTRITYGFFDRSTASGRSTGFRIASRASASADSSARVRKLGALDLAVQVRQDDLRRVDPDVGGKQARLELLEQGGVDATPWQEIRDPGCGAADARAQAHEKGILLAGTGSGCYGWITVAS